MDVYVNIDIYTHIESPISSFDHLNLDVGCLVNHWCFSVTIIKEKNKTSGGTATLFVSVDQQDMVLHCFFSA